MSNIANLSLMLQHITNALVRVAGVKDTQVLVAAHYKLHNPVALNTVRIHPLKFVAASKYEKGVQFN